VSGPAKKRVVVVRAAHQADRLSARLVTAGFEPVLMPVISIEPADDGGAALRSALAEGGFDWIVFTSSNAVASVGGLVASLGSLFDGAAIAIAGAIAAIGPGTSHACRERGWTVTLESTVSTAEGLVAEFATLRPGRVLLPLAQGARRELPDGLRTAGWDVVAVEAYRTVPRVPTDAELTQARDCDAVLFTSSSSVTSWCDVIAVQDTPGVVISIGPQTSQTARSCGLAVAAEADPHTLDGLVAAAVAAMPAAISPDR
jgi:uroporphyrinogen-III synthase